MSEVIRNAGKFNTILLFAALVTASLFYSMQLLIMSDDSVPARMPKTIMPEITMPEWELKINHITPKPEAAETPPEVPVLEFNETADVTVPTHWVKPLPTNEPVDFDPDNFFGPTDGNAIPVAQIQPVYPTRAAERGIEGSVIVEFDVSENGTVINPRILLSQPEGMFDRASLRAIERWKYQPRIVDGRAVEMKGIQTRFTFNLKND